MGGGRVCWGSPMKPEVNAPLAQDILLMLPAEILRADAYLSLYATFIFSMS